MIHGETIYFDEVEYRVISFARLEGYLYWFDDQTPSSLGFVLWRWVLSLSARFYSQTLHHCYDYELLYYGEREYSGYYMQYAIRAFEEALVSVPIALADNSGLQPCIEHSLLQSLSKSKLVIMDLFLLLLNISLSLKDIGYVY